jgi:hypothetical protein
MPSLRLLRLFRRAALYFNSGISTEKSIPSTWATMSTINVASKANQAITLPIVLVAQYANESDLDPSISVSFEEVEALKPGDQAVVELVDGSSTSTYGFEQVMNGLIQKYSCLQGQNEKAVCWG